jgi:hypothetical protein
VANRSKTHQKPSKHGYSMQRHAETEFDRKNTKNLVGAPNHKRIWRSTCYCTPFWNLESSLLEAFTSYFLLLRHARNGVAECLRFEKPGLVVG